MFGKLLSSDKKSEKSSEKSSQKISSSVEYPNNFTDTALTVTAPKSPSSFADNRLTKLTNDSVSFENLDSIIEAGYKQVFGNVGLMESERLLQVESQLRSGQITVKDFIRQLAKSEKYRALFWDGNSNLKAIELNFKHLLGRTPENYQEISEHIKIISENGFAAEIDSYLDNEEYDNNFGKTLIPYYRGYTTQTGNNLAGYKYSAVSAKFTSSSDTSSSTIASLKLLGTNKIEAQDRVLDALPYFGSQDQGVRPSDQIPEELVERLNVIATGLSSTSYRRKPVVDKKFLNMARNTPYGLR